MTTTGRGSYDYDYNPDYHNSDDGYDGKSYDYIGNLSINLNCSYIPLKYMGSLKSACRA